MKKLILAFLILGGGGGYAYYHFVIQKPVEKPTVTRAPVTQGNITEVVSATGQLEPWKRVDVGSQVSGVVQKMFVDFNSTVKEGQVLAQIDPTLLQVQVEIQKANIQRNESDIANQKVGLEDLKRQMGRTKEMFDKGLQNQQQLEAAELAVKNRDAQIVSAEKQLVSARAQLDQAQMNVNYTTIKSPIDGVVIERKVDVGQTVQSSMSVASFFVLITPLNQLRLTAGVDEADIGKVRAGMDVSFTVETYGQKQFWGVVDAVRLNATVQNNVVTYPVWIKVDNPDLALRPSLTASAKIVISQATNVTRIPNSAFRFKPNPDIYTALGLEPPAAGKGRRLGGPADDNSTKAGPGTGGAPGANGQPGAAGAGQAAPNPQATNGQDGKGANGQAGATNPQARADGQNRQPGTGSGGTGGRGGDRNASGGRGFGAQSGMPNLTPEQMAAFRERFGQGQTGRSNRSSSGGRGGGGGQNGQNPGGRGGGARPATPQGPPVEITEGHKIDEYFSPVPRAESRNAVWTWDETKKELKEIQVRLGVTDGTFSELVQGDVKAGDQLVTGVLLPRPAATAPGGAGSLFGQPQRGNQGFGPTPGGGGPGGGGGGGGRGGGGGGGRGGL